MPDDQIPEIFNFFSQLPATMPSETTQILLQTRTLRIERILSKGHCSPPGFWYDQPENEWILLLQGAARLEFENQKTLNLTPGDSLQIPVGQRHRVEWTDPNQVTIWLAVFS